MIKTIIFDFGDVFLNLDKPATNKTLDSFGIKEITPEIQRLNETYEVGNISTDEFLKSYQEIIPGTTKEQLIEAWNAILVDFPKYRLDFIQKLAADKRYKLLLLSNTNDLHINWVKDNIPFYEEFKNCFASFYLSHEIHFRKPNADIFEFVIKEHNLTPSETLFIDDTKDNTDTAQQLGIHVWNNNPKTEDIINIFSIKSDLF